MFFGRRIPRMKVVTPLAVAALAVSLGIVPAARAAGDGKVATVGEHAITRAQLEEHVRAKLIELENQRYELLREGLDEMIAEELVKQEASARKTTPADLEKLVAGQHQLRDHVHQMLERLDIDADRLAGDLGLGPLLFARSARRQS